MLISFLTKDDNGRWVDIESWAEPATRPHKNELVRLDSGPEMRVLEISCKRAHMEVYLVPTYVKV